MVILAAVPPLPPQCQVKIVPADESRKPAPVKKTTTLVFVHGWPDTIALWEPTQRHFASLGYRTASVGLPGYGTGTRKARGFTFKEADELLQQAITHVAQGDRITLIGHDWGAMFVSRLERTSLDQIVDKYVKLDVGEGFDATPISVLAVLAYQLPLVVAFFIGGIVGGFVTKLTATLVGAPDPPADSFVNWPYPEFQSMLLRSLNKVKAQQSVPDNSRPRADQRGRKPLLYMYGTRKPLQFHSEKWVQSVANRTDGSKVVSLPSDHWFLVRQKTRDDFLRHLQDFLESAPAPAAADASAVR